MTEEEIRKRAFAMPLTSPAFPPDPTASSIANTSSSPIEPIRSGCARWCPSHWRSTAPLVKYEFIRMPNSTGFGDYTESGQVIPVSLNGRRGSYTHCMFLDDESPIAGGRELWGFPKKLASPSLQARRIRWSARSTTARCAWPLARWAINTARWTLRRSRPRYPRRIS